MERRRCGVHYAGPPGLNCFCVDDSPTSRSRLFNFGASRLSSPPTLGGTDFPRLAPQIYLLDRDSH
jgi:hypothetical protein